jgi:glucose dehydrogenase
MDRGKTPAADWPTIGGNLGQTRFSTLNEITTSNVGQLQLAWTTAFDGDVSNAVETELLVSSGLLYLVTGNGNVVAADATSGRKVWQWNTPEPPRPPTLTAPNRGPALGGGRVYIQTTKGVVVALDAKTGRQLWQTTVSLNGGLQQGASAPVYYDGTLYVGVAGHEQGRGHVDALSADDGHLLWRTFTVGSAEDDPKTGGGGVWTSPSIDPELGLLYAVTGNAGNLTTATNAEWSASILALELKTGGIKWAFQGVHHDIWDYDCPSPPVFFDVTVKGVRRHGVEFQCKPGYQFELDRATGAPLLPVTEVPIPEAPGGSHPDPAAMAANPFVSKTEPQMQGTNNIVPHCVSREMLPPLAPDGTEYRYGCTYSIPAVGGYNAWTPSTLGGITWQASAVDGLRGYVYVCALAGAAQAWKVDPTAPSGRRNGGRFVAPAQGWSGSLAAIDLRTNTTVWLNKWVDGRTCLSGVTATAGGIVFTADLQSTGPSRVYAFDSGSGKQLWSFQTTQTIASAPVVYAVNGRQYVAYIGGGPIPILGGMPAPFRRRDEVYVFALPRRGSRPVTLTTSTAMPQEPQRTATPISGPARDAFVARCGTCHTLRAAGTTGIGGPDLGISGRIDAARVIEVVTRGKSGPLGTMPAFSGTLTQAEIDQIAQFVAWATER